MEWANKRKWMVWSVLGACLLAVLLILGFAIFYKTPTCTDQKQDGAETGIDCGGSCSTVCSAEAQPASVRFARVLSQSGRNDLIAYIDNPNQDAYGKDAEVSLDIYLQDGHTLNRHARVSLPAKSSAPVFIPGIAQSAVQQAFASLVPGSVQWMKGSGWDITPPAVSNILVESADSRPRITATLTNKTAYPQNNVPLIATVFSADGTALAASQTVVPLLPPQGTAQAVFTWNEPFSAPYARIEILPVIALPALVP